MHATSEGQAGFLPNLGRRERLGWSADEKRGAGTPACGVPTHRDAWPGLRRLYQ